jgi:hypothetical protein
VVTGGEGIEGAKAAAGGALLNGKWVNAESSSSSSSCVKQVSLPGQGRLRQSDRVSRPVVCAVCAHAPRNQQ